MSTKTLDAASDLDLFNAAREAGLPPVRAARYVQHVRLYQRTGRAPLSPSAAALASSIARAASAVKGLSDAAVGATLAMKGLARTAASASSIEVPGQEVTA